MKKIRKDRKKANHYRDKHNALIKKATKSLDLDYLNSLPDYNFSEDSPKIPFPYGRGNREKYHWEH